MITRTSREIIRNAKTLANADNSSFTDFFLNTTLLNNAYREIYDILVSNSKAFVNTIEVNDDTFLPYDCYSIISVTDRAGNPIHQEALVGSTSGGWQVENNVFKYPKNKFGATFLITYATIPATITAPDVWVDVTMPDDFVDGTPYAVDFDKTTETITLTQLDINNIYYLGKKLEYNISAQTFVWNGKNFYDYISRQDENGNEIQFTNIQVDSPYMVVSYADGKVYVFTGWLGTEWNYNCIFGHETLGECVALKTDDVTGFGMVFYNNADGNYKYAPFVPDTILSYPNNTLFAYMEYRIAFQIASLLNMNVEFLKNELERAETNFYKNIANTNNVHRINNFHRMKGVLYAGGML